MVRFLDLIDRFFQSLAGRDNGVDNVSVHGLFDVCTNGFPESRTHSTCGGTSSAEDKCSPRESFAYLLDSSNLVGILIEREGGEKVSESTDR